MIIALCIVSASEIAKVVPSFTYDMVENEKDKFLDILYQFGMDVKQTIETQKDLMHRNRMNNIVQCDRYVGYERTDKEWIESRFASKEAKDKATGNKLIKDIYRMRGYTE